MPLPEPWTMQMFAGPQTTCPPTKSHGSPTFLPIGVGMHTNFVTMSSGQHVSFAAHANGFEMQLAAPPPPVCAGVLHAAPAPNGAPKAKTQMMRFLLTGTLRSS